ncbi:MAG: hypothetical protein IJA15_06095 [Clostridia bacterium]|nr:hypothetical protein [Clostridia bacterium]
MKNKLIVTLLTIVLIASFGFACTKPSDNSSKPASITLVDFEATKTEEAVLYGELYELRRFVTDEEGNEYSLIYQVKDSTGAIVVVIANCFEAIDLGGYTITYTAEVADGDVRTSVVTLPVYDGEGPSIIVSALDAGEVNVPYVLPEIAFNDLTEIVEKSVKVYLVGEELTEIALTETDGKYGFTPTLEGTYRLSVYAKDVAGNETTVTKEFFIEKILVGEILNPVSSKAQAQVYFGSNSNVFVGSKKEIVTAEENTDTTYGGSYMRVEAANPNNGWGNIFVDPRFEASEYASFELVTFWIYMESTDILPINVLFFNDSSLTKSVNANEWTLVTIEATKFFELLDTTYFIAARYNDKTTGIRISEILAVNPAEFSISSIEEVRLSGESATVEFTVTANPADTEYNVSVANSAGEALEVVALGGGKYQVTVTALGEYFVKVSATNGRQGIANAKFNVVEPNRIVLDGEYAKATGVGREFNILGAYVARGEQITDETVTVKLYALDGEEWVDVSSEIADGKYVPTSAGKIKVEYSSEGIAPAVYELDVLDYSVIFNPALENADSYVMFGVNNDVFEFAEKVFISAEENTDAIYGGAYLKAIPTNRNNWGNIWIMPKYTAEDYCTYDFVTAWIKVLADDNNPVTALFAYNTNTQTVEVNKWIQVAIPMDDYITSLESGTPVFIALNYKATVSGVYIGEIKAANSAEISISDIGEIVLTGESVNVEFTVTANPANTEYNVSVVNAEGEALQVTSLGDGRYQVAVSVIGEYTVSARAIGDKYGVASTKFTLVESVRLIVDGEYAKTVGFGEELAIIGAHIERGESATDEAVTVKLYALSGEEWIDISSEIAEGKYIPTAEGRIKVEYSFEGLDTIVYEIAVVDPSVVFNPTAENMSQISANGKAFNHGNSATYTFVSDEQNTDETYGGAYVKINSSSLPASTVWGSVLLAPARDASTYSKYDAVEIWLYVERNGSGDELVSFFGTLSGSNIAWATTATVTANKWVRVQLPMEQFIANQEYFFGRNLNANASWGVIGFRVGQVSAVNTAEIAISDIEESVLDGESVNVEFTVTANPAETELAVSVVSALGETLEVVALGDGRYQVAVSAIGEYTVIAQAAGDIRGEAQAKFTVVESVRLIVDGEYAQTVGMGKQLTILGAHIQRGQTATDDVVTVKLFALNGEEWVEVTSEIVEGKYVHAVEGKLKVQYSFEGLDSIEYQIDVCDYSILFDPALESAASQVMYGTNNSVFQNAEKVFVSAEENTDETYGGAYLKAIPTNRINWGNVFVTPKYATEAFAEYDVVTAWIYVLADDNNPVTALFALNANTQTVAVNQWVQIAIPMDVYVTSVESGTPVFIALNYKATVSGVYIGEIKAANSAELSISNIEESVLDGESVNVEFTVTANPAETELAVSVVSALGETLEVVALGGGKYQVAVSAIGEYTVNVSVVGGLWGKAQAKFTVIEALRLVVDGEYEQTAGVGKELALVGAHIERGTATTDDVVTVKVYALNGEEWLDVSDKIADGKYIPEAVGKIKVEYSFEGVDSIAYEITVLDPSIVFDPTLENMSQILANGKAFNYGNSATYTFVSDEQNADETYGGAYVKINSSNLPASTVWGNVLLTPAHDASSYSEYDAVEIWLYVERNGSGDEAVSFFGTLSGSNIVWANTVTVTANQWVKVQLPIDQFIANQEYFFGRNLNANASWGVIGFRVGKITAVNVAEEPEDNNYYVFKPVAENLAQLNCTTGAGFTNNQATFEFVSAANNNNETYGGAYVKISTTALSSTGNKWGDIRLTPEHDLSSYAEYTNILVWICVQSNTSSSFTYSLYGGIASQSVVDNTWVQISIPAEAFVNKTSDILYALNFNNNASWGRTAVLIGEIIAVK